MDKRIYKKTGEEISLLGLGLMRLPLRPGTTEGIDGPAAEQLVDICYNAGVNYFDTAYFYHGGESESFAGNALKKYPRDSYHLATKLPVHLIESAEHAEQIFAEQLARCQVEYFDFYLFHSVGAEGFEKIKNFGLYELMQKKVAEGKIRNLGFSFHDKPEVLEEICDAYQWDFVQIQLNYQDWDHMDAERMYKALESRGIPCIVMEPVRGGRLADLGPEANAVLEAAAPGKSVASWAIRWVASLPNVLCVLSGMSSEAQVQDNLATTSPLVPFTEAEAAALAKALPIFRKVATVPCTGCRYCVPCPAGVHIPEMIELRNRTAFDGGAWGLQNAYGKVPEEENAGNCISCGVCEGKCPQHLPISDIMHKLHEAAAGQA